MDKKKRYLMVLLVALECLLATFCITDILSEESLLSGTILYQLWLVWLVLFVIGILVVAVIAMRQKDEKDRMRFLWIIVFLLALPIVEWLLMVFRLYVLVKLFYAIFFS